MFYRKLSRLRQQGANQTSGFCKMKKCWCVRGKYPPHLLDLWDDYDSAGAGSENDSPKMFKSDQLYIVLELEDGGKDLESFVFNSAEQCLSIFIQVRKYLLSHFDHYVCGVGDTLYLSLPLQ